MAATGWSEAIIARQGAAGGWLGGLVISWEPQAPSWLGLAQWQAVRGVGAGQEPGQGAQGLLTEGQCPVCLAGLWRVAPPPVACG